MNYHEVLEYLKEVESRGINPGLDNTVKLLEHMKIQSPETPGGITFIQVAGTNGKGSTSHFIASILEDSGYKVGLFTSPHLVDIRERIVINRQMISREDFAKGLGEIKVLAEELLSNGAINAMPSYFEYTFLTALYHFSHSEVDIAILEVGLGGRWDATSAITPKVSVITTISRDHTHVLGNRLQDIAAEKAAIIKKGIPVVCGCKKRTVAHQVIKKNAGQQEAPFFNVIDTRNRLEVQYRDDGYRCSYSTHPIPARYLFDVRLKGSFQTQNAATAIKAVQVLDQTLRRERGMLDSVYFPISPDNISRGIENCSIPARIEVLDTSPPVILDGGHNIESLTGLVKFLQERNKYNLTLIYGVLADKNYKKMSGLLLPHVQHVLLAAPNSKRALPSEKLLGMFKYHGKSVIIKKTIEDAYQTARQFDSEILVTGSFYLVGELRRMIMKDLSRHSIQYSNTSGISGG
jgi:dihydrofolate synthase / folylpolyglutamate synthase